MDTNEIGARVTAALSDELRRAPWKGSACPVAGHCYVASEAAYHMLGGRAAGWTPASLRHEGATHWFLRHQDGSILDLTAGQFGSVPPYASGVGRGFLTAQPSRRAQVVIDRASDVTRRA